MTQCNATSIRGKFRINLTTADAVSSIKPLHNSTSHGPPDIVHMAILSIQNTPLRYVCHLNQIFVRTSTPANVAIISMTFSGSGTCHFAEVILLAAPTVTEITPSTGISFSFRNCRNISTINPVDETDNLRQFYHRQRKTQSPDRQYAPSPIERRFVPY